jgi:AraC-like DNA-binding protein
VAIVFCGTDFDGLDLMAVGKDQQSWRMFHERYAIAILFSGSATLSYRGREIDGRANLVNVFEPGEVHFNTAVRSPVTFAVAFVPAKLVQDAAAELGYSGTLHFAAEGDCSDQRLTRSLVDFIEIAGAREPGADAAFSDFAGCLIERLAEKQFQHAVPTTGRALDAVIEAARSGGRCPTTTELAQLERISERQLHRSFKRHQGMSPVEVFQLARISKVIGGKSEARSLAELASECGFADQSHMNRVVRRVMSKPVGRIIKELRTPEQGRLALELLRRNRP